MSAQIEGSVTPGFEAVADAFASAPRPAVIVTAPDSSACDVDPLVVTCIARKPRGIIQMLSILAEFAARFEPASGVEESGDGFHRVNEPETGETGDDVGGDRRLRLGRKDR